MAKKKGTKKGPKEDLGLSPEEKPVATEEPSVEATPEYSRDDLMSDQDKEERDPEADSDAETETRLASDKEGEGPPSPEPSDSRSSSDEDAKRSKRASKGKGPEKEKLEENKSQPKEDPESREARRERRRARKTKHTREEAMKNEFLEGLSTLEIKMYNLLSEHDQVVYRLEKKTKDQERELAQMKLLISTTTQQGYLASTLRKPEPYDGTFRPRKLRAWLLQMAGYLKIVGYTKATWVISAQTYFVGTAAPW